MQENKLKTKLKEGKVALGTFNRLGPAALEIIGHAGWDFVVIDMEHGGFEIPQVEHMLRAAKSSGITGLVRVAEPRPSYIMRALDAGAQGVQIPQVETGEGAELVTQAARYYPEGNRGLCSFVRASGYRSIEPDVHIATSNQEVLTVVHIEGELAAKNAEQLLAAPGLDVLFLGPWDLSQSLGVPGQTDHPKVIKVMEEVTELCKEKGKWVGTFITKPEDAYQWAEKGIQYLMYSTDAGMMVQAARERLQEINDALKG
ncbi:MAG: HpcH/HpaI aldolase family protein [Peptococcaceae bacterium]